MIQRKVEPQIIDLLSFPFIFFLCYSSYTMLGVSALKHIHTGTSSSFIFPALQIPGATLGRIQACFGTSSHIPGIRLQMIDSKPGFVPCLLLRTQYRLSVCRIS